MNRILPFRLILCAVLSACTIAGVLALNSKVLASPQDQQSQNLRPNIVLINLDDADVELLRPAMLQQYYPNMHALASRSIRFTNLHATTPFCGPSRASLFRGQYAFNTGVKVNDESTSLSNGFPGGYGEFTRRGYQNDELGVWMKNSGYRTMHVGKYHHHDFDGRMPPGWDEFRMTAGARYLGSYRFSNAASPQGRWFRTPEDAYVTRVDADDAAELIESHGDRDDPFFLYVAPIAPHSDQSGVPEAMVEQRYRNFAAGLSLPISPDLFEADVSDKPRHLRIQTPPFWKDYSRRLYISRVRAIKSVDDLIGRIVASLESIGAKDNTYVIVTSDNGFQLGHHNLLSKIDPFHRTTNVPLLVSGPDVPDLADQNEFSHLLAHIDICPTILDLAGAPIPNVVDGRSFAPLIRNPDQHDQQSWQPGIMIENWAKKNNFGRRVTGTYVAWRQHHEIFVSWANGQYEYYDLDADPYQLDNAWRDLPVSRKQELKRLVRRFRRNDTVPITTVDSYFERKIQPSRVHLRGYSEDNAGVDRTLVTMKSLTTGRFWNGESWQDQWFGHYLSNRNRNQPISVWNFRTNVHTETADAADMVVFSYRTIGTDGEIPDTVSWHVAELDAGMPRADFLDYAARPQFEGFVNLEGTVFDIVEIDNALLTIKQLGTNRYWNGSAFQDGRFELPTEVVGGSWSYRGNLPRGSYRAGIRGIDKAGNRQHPANSLRFSVN